MRAKAHKKVSRVHRPCDLYTTYYMNSRPNGYKYEAVARAEEKQTHREIFGLGDVSTKSFAK